MREQRVDEIGLVDAARLRLEHEAHWRIPAGLVAHRVEQPEHGLLGLQLFGRERLLAELDLRIGLLFDFLEHLLRGRIRRQFRDHQLPLAACEFFDLPARAHLQAAATGLIRRGDFRFARNNLAAAREVRSRNVLHQFGMRQVRVADHRDRGARDFAQVVRRNFRGQTHRDARCAVEQHERQTRGQQPRLVELAVVVLHEINRALVDLVEQQLRDRRQARFGVAHGRCAVAVARTEVTLAVDQRVAHREVLREAHQRVVRRLVAVRVVLTQHVADHACGLDRLRVVGQAHVVHREQDAALHRFLAVAHVRQRAAFDHAHRILEVRAFRVIAERQKVALRGRRRGEKVESVVVVHLDSVSVFGLK
ncbi:hypothetical protein GGD41_006165 [Paraburkholderia bryophila]|uniref:Uncharacterized protein n=1 Tax=Paraburkholderia bryophila TaxID=420952 RepID=A0A7Z0B433_9BURK|nr:hypothetical protein [Paraburkholderia bryophila]